MRIGVDRATAITLWHVALALNVSIAELLKEGRDGTRAARGGFPAR